MKRISCLYLIFFATIAIGQDNSVWYPDKSKTMILRDGSGQETAIVDAEGWSKRRVHILRNMQLVMGKMPDSSRKVPADPKVEEEKDMGSYTRLKMTIAVEKDDRLPIYLLVPKIRNKKLPAMICLHQTNGAAGKKGPAGLADRRTMHIGMELAERGYVVLAPDYPNFGEYKIDIYKNGYTSATMKGIWNHMRCVDFLSSRIEVDPEKIGVIGHSLGGHNSIFLGVFDERIKAVVTSCGFCSFPTYMKGNLNGWSHKGYMPLIKSTYDASPQKMPWDFTEAIAALAPRAFFTYSPQKDDNFDVQGVKDCINAAEPVYKLLKASEKLVAHYPDRTHDFPDAMRKVAYEWLDRALEVK